jgi:subtilisin family serine protease
MMNNGRGKVCYLFWGIFSFCLMVIVPAEALSDIKANKFPSVGIDSFQPPGAVYKEGEVLVKFKSPVNHRAAKKFASRHKMSFKKSFRTLSRRRGKSYGLLKSALTTREMMRRLKMDPLVEAVSPNYIRKICQTTPNDPLFSELWGLHNTADTDIDAPEAWDINTGSSGVVVAVIDTGIDYTHEELAANLWVNTTEAGGTTGVDDDGNGYVDDIYGYDFAGDDNGANDPYPFDIMGHGTHVSGTIAAEGNNNTSVAGVNWYAQIMALKAGMPSGGLMDSDIIEAIEYGITMKADYGVNIVAMNASWGGYGFSLLLRDAIEEAGAEDIAFVASAGNSDLNTDLYPHYPTAYELTNIIAVAATDQDDQRSGFSNFGRTTVDLGAPGENILSTIPGGGYAPQAGDIFFDDMESGDGNWSHTSNKTDWAISTEQSHSPDHAWSDSPGANYQIDTEAYLTVDSDIDLSGATGQDIRLGFWASLDLEAGWDFLFVEISGDSGANWESIALLTGEGLDWDLYAYPIPERHRTPHFRFRFYLLTDYIYNYDGVHIDDVGIGIGDGYSTNLAYYNGTSMAAPHVTGAVALMAAQYPSEGMYFLINRIFSGVDTLSSMSGRARTDGRLNLAGSIDAGLVLNPLITAGISDREGVQEGDTITLTGIEFGETEGELYFTNEFGVGVAAAVSDWSDTAVTATIPAEAYKYIKVKRADDAESLLEKVSVWTRKKPSLEGRTSAAAVACNGKIYLLGGDTNGPDYGGGRTDSAEVYDTVTDTWTPIASIPVAKEKHTAAVIDGEIYVIGGFSAGVYAYNPDLDSWSTKADLPVNSTNLKAVSLNGNIYVTGGYLSSGVKTVYMYDPLTDAWTQKADMNTGRQAHSAAALNGKIYVFGGSSSYTTSTPLRSAEVYDPATDTWTYISDMPVRVCEMGAATDGSKIYLTGGRYRYEEWKPYWVEYDPGTDTYYYKTSGIKELPRGKQSSPMVYVPGYGVYSINGYYITGELDEVIHQNVGPAKIPGDFYGDGDVDGEDLADFIHYYSTDHSAADLNNDGFVDAGDAETFSGQFGSN